MMSVESALEKAKELHRKKISHWDETTSYSIVKIAELLLKYE